MTTDASEELVTVKFTPAAYAALKAVSRSQNKTISETIRDGLKWQRFVWDLRRDGGKLLTLEDGKVRELYDI